MVSTKKVVLGAVTALVGVVGSGAAAIALTMPSGVDGPGAAFAELQGHTQTADHATADVAPREDVPAWTRAVGSDVTVVRPGEAAGDDAGSVRVHMTLTSGTTLPAHCTPLDQVGMPFDGGGRWPDLGDEAHLCDGWVTVVLGDQLYAWTDDQTRG
ncbi:MULTISPECIES: hypothetical protein [unclassified Modestobacter]|uniref:hypothetical protein n=1 Tax=unclassified Modestobacter TaxID=2643866 RepID=UPI0022AA9F2C|nr:MULTISPECIES: hypothetical protein [unclassified Modestobacter]MCZ2823230.1 hypothetical protein [Modestobacter sp. VKM Ac-2981]MCZ2851475.1 hypothetical protein [Modestobacter sp. VKM Ac-2982]